LEDFGLVSLRSYQVIVGHNNIVGCRLTIDLLYGFVGFNALTGPIPSELGLLTSLQSLDFGKFAIVSSMELDTIILLESVLQLVSSMVL
jgi:hypothetical protein